MWLRTLFFAFSLAATYLPAALADGYSTGTNQQTIDDAKARRALTEVTNFNMNDVWYATGLEDYYKSPACLIARDIYVFTKPVLTSPGLYRGKKMYITEYNEPRGSNACNQLNKKELGFTVETASFIKPDDLSLDEDYSGKEPGLFQVSDKITDKELLALGAIIPEIQSCLKNENACPFKLENDASYTKSYTLIPTFKLSNLLSVGLRKEYGTDKEYYEAFFAEESPNFGAIAVDIYYRNEIVTKISMTDEVLE